MDYAGTKSADDTAAIARARRSRADTIREINRIWDIAAQQREALLAKEEAFWAQCEREGPPKDAAGLQQRNAQLINLQMETIGLCRQIAHQSQRKIRSILENTSEPDRAN